MKRLLDCGADPEDLATLITSFQTETIGNFFYFLDDPGATFGDEFAEELRFGIYMKDKDGNPIPDSDDQWRCFHEALPSGYEVLNGKDWDA